MRHGFLKMEYNMRLKEKNHMNNLIDEIKERIKISLEITKELEDPFNKIAFKIILKYLLMGIERISKQSIGSLTQIQKIQKLSISEFILRLRSKTFVDRCLGIIYFLIEFENRNVVTIKEIEREFEKAKIVKPKNFSDIVNNLIKKGLVAEAELTEDRKRQFYITQTGMELVEKNLLTIEK